MIRDAWNYYFFLLSNEGTSLMWQTKVASIMLGAVPAAIAYAVMRWLYQPD